MSLSTTALAPVPFRPHRRCALLHHSSFSPIFYGVHLLLLFLLSPADFLVAAFRIFFSPVVDLTVSGRPQEYPPILVPKCCLVNQQAFSRLLCDTPAACHAHVA
jgi:hypothetical protein